MAFPDTLPTLNEARAILARALSTEAQASSTLTQTEKDDCAALCLLAKARGFSPQNALLAFCAESGAHDFPVTRQFDPSKFVS